MLNGFRERSLILGLTRQEMAKKIGVTPITITMWEKGENLPRRGVRERLAAENARLVAREAEQSQDIVDLNAEISRLLKIIQDAISVLTV